VARLSRVVFGMWATSSSRAPGASLIVASSGPKESELHARRPVVVESEAPTLFAQAPLSSWRGASGESLLPPPPRSYDDVVDDAIVAGASLIVARQA